MGIFDRLFRAVPKAVSRLDVFISDLGEDEIRHHGQSARKSGLGVASVISMLILKQSGQFAHGLLDDLKKSPIPVSTPTGGERRFDAIVTEAAALLHYSLLARDIAESLDDDAEDDDVDEDSPLIVAARDAQTLTGTLLGELVSFEFNETLFRNRPAAYGILAKRRLFVETFDGLLLSAIRDGKPTAFDFPSGLLNFDLGLPLVLAAHSRAFSLSMIPAIRDMANNAVTQAKELGLA